MTTENTSGFYKKFSDSNYIIHAHNFVSTPSFELLRETKDEFEYPMDGWYWFDDEKAAHEFFGQTVVEDGGSE